MTPPIFIKASDAHYPPQLARRLSHTVPASLVTLIPCWLGGLFISNHKTAPIFAVS